MTISSADIRPMANRQDLRFPPGSATARSLIGQTGRDNVQLADQPLKNSIGDRGEMTAQHGACHLKVPVSEAAYAYRCSRHNHVPTPYNWPGAAQCHGS